MLTNFTFVFLARAQETPPDETSTEEVQTESEPQESVEEDAGGDDGTDGPDGVPIDEDPQEGDDGENGDEEEPGEDGGEGDDGEGVGDEPLPDGEAAEIDTGDATAGSAAGTEANTTDIDTNTASTTPAASSTPETPGSGEADINVGNEILGTTTASSTAQTGNNAGIDPDGVIIESGDGTAWVYDLFFFNFALVDSSGGIEVVLNPNEDELDFTQRILDMFSDLAAPEECTLPGCKTADAMIEYNGSSTAALDRTTEATAECGDNYGKAKDGLVYINVGDCHSSNVTITAGNWFLYNSRYMVLLMNNVGDLSGNIILPGGSFFEGLRGGAFAPGTTVSSTNDTDLTVNATSTAENGGNSANGEQLAAIGGGAGADASSGVYNGVNQMNPPICFIISVGGEWDGDVYQIPDGFNHEHMPWGDVVCGRGGAASDPLAIHATTTNYAKVVVNAISQALGGNNSGEGEAVVIEPGKVESFLFVLNLINLSFYNQDWMFGLFTVSGDWDGSFYFGTPPNPTPAEQAAGNIVNSSSGKKGSKKEASSPVKLTKISSTATITSGSIVEYTITLKNNGPKVYGAKMEDVLMYPSGATMNTQNWDLGTVLADEVITVSYTMQFSGNLAPGGYTNAVRLTGHSGSEDGPAIKPVYASVVVTAGGVLGLGECPAYLTHYISPAGGNNPEQVRLLEEFLRDARHEALVPDGIYDPASVEAIKKFQQEYASDILSPWGIGFATGQVYYTTQKKINEIFCAGQKDFALTGGQLAEITHYRQFVLGQGPLSPQLVGTPPQDLSEVFELKPLQIVKKPLLSPLQRSSMFSSSLFNTLFNWMSVFTSVPVAEAANY